jgi:hypothetical protein
MVRAVGMSYRARLRATRWLIRTTRGCQPLCSQFNFEAADGVCCGCSSIFNAASSALRRCVAAAGVQRNLPLVTNFTSTGPFGAGDSVREASSTWIAPDMTP